ncbi:MAG: anaerobic carbon-monoxide dehydrogenase catalytic subunit [Deltaproteobacteria bacterium]|nr:anaerobic carbon-monoxide dehydrogenase catalytic subunit [Deltaproteobacteria bacterium]
MVEKEKQSVDPATQEMIEKAAQDGIRVAFERAATMKACPIGAEGSCCSLCAMGPCRVMAPKGKEETLDERRNRVGVCGATPETISARNFARKVAAGTASHGDHGRFMARFFLAVAKGELPGYEIKDEQKLLLLALELGVKIADRDKGEIAAEVAKLLIQEFGKQEGELLFLKRAPEKRQRLWRELGVSPRGIDLEVAEALHRTHMGTDQDYQDLLDLSVRVALADGWGGSMIATEIQDIVFGSPVPVAGKINLGVLKEEEVNIIVHGHEPQLAEMLAVVAQSPEMIQYAKTKGARGINLAGMCCTANEMLMRRGLPVAGNFLQQELAVVTGALEAMVVDVQCIMQGLVDTARCYHTRIVTTDPRAKIQGATHMPFDEHRALESAQAIVRLAVDNYVNRGKNIRIPRHTTPLIAGFTYESINYMLGGSFRGSFRPLNDNIINGRIRGVAGVVGCNNPRTPHDASNLAMVKELIRNDVLVLQTGCMAMASAKAGLMVPEAAQFAGEGLASVCEAVGMPPVLHMGACIDNSRILIAAAAMVNEGGLGDDLSKLPVAGAAPEWMSEKALAIGQYFVGSGIFTVFGVTWPTIGSQEVTEYLFRSFEDKFGGKWAFEPDPVEAARLMIGHIDKKRKALDLDRGKGRLLVDMGMRRGLDAA